jgi:hypothetical protein
MGLVYVFCGTCRIRRNKCTTHLGFLDSQLTNSWVAETEQLIMLMFYRPKWNAVR